MLSIDLSGSSPIDDFLMLSKTIQSDVHQENSMSFTKLNSNYGDGIIAITQISDTITNLSFDVTFKDDVELKFLANKSHYVDFIYCLEGSVGHKFKDASLYESIGFRQNSIISRGANSKSQIKFSSNEVLRLNIITYKNVLESLSTNKNKLNQLRDNALVKLSDTFSQDNFRYLGRICFKTAIFAQEALKHALETSSEIFFKEAAILNTMASQIQRYQEDIDSNLADAPIRQSEIDKIIALESFIINNISEDLSVERLVSLSGLNAGKLQVGFKYLFNETISCYVREKRLDKAASLIKETEFNVSELVYSVGFSSRSYFSKIFKERYGILPSKCVSNPNLLMVV